MEKANLLHKRIYATIGALYILTGFLLAVGKLTGFSVIILNQFNQSAHSFIGVVFFLAGIMLLMKSRRRIKKGQAAMEFLMTYGWAILSSVILIGVLTGYVLNKNPNEIAIVSAPFYAVGHTISNDISSSPGLQPGILLEIKNQGGQTYTITNITIKSNDGQVICSSVSQYVLQPSQSNVTEVYCSALPKENAVQADIQIRYTKIRSSLESSSEGFIYGRIAGN